MAEQTPTPLPPSLPGKGEESPPRLAGEGVRGEVAPENRSTLDRLVRSVDMAEGFALFFARCNVPALRSELILSARQQLAALGVEVIEVAFEDEPVNVRQQLRAALAATDAKAEAPTAVALPFPTEALALAEPRTEYVVGGKRAVFVIGLELGIPYDQPNARVLVELNLGRDLFPRDAPHPLVLWLPDYALTAVARYAPDFWAWRSGVFEFVTEERQRHAAFRQYTSEDRPWRMFTNLTPEARLLRRRQLESLLDDYRNLPDDSQATQERARILADLGAICAAGHESVAAIGYYEQALPIYRQMGDRRGEATLLNGLGRIYEVLGEARQALDLYEQALKLVRSVEDSNGEAATLNNIGRAYDVLGDKHKALDFYERALLLRRQLNDRGGEASTLHNIGEVYATLGNHHLALDSFEQALTISRQAGDQRSELNALNRIGEIYAAEKEWGLASEHFEQALMICRHVDDRRGEATTLTNIGAVYSALGDQRQALAFYKQALELMRQVGNRGGEATTLNNIGLVYAALDEVSQAMAYFEQSLELIQQVDDRWAEVITRSNIGALLLNMGEQEKAEKALQEAVELAEKVGHPQLPAIREWLARAQGVEHEDAK